jgi:hypothetical protein
VTSESLADTTYAYAGKRKDGATYYLWQTYMRFNLSVIPDSHAVQSVTARIYIHTDGTDADQNFKLWVLAATYGTLDALDWEAAGVYGAVVASATDIKTDPAGVQYIDFAFTPDMLLTISSTTTAHDMRLEVMNESAAPAAGAYLKLYSPNHSTLRPYLYVETCSRREQILQALVTTLDGIDEYAGYATTPKVSRVLQPIPILQDESQYPIVAIVGQMDTYPHTVSQADDCDWKIIVAAGVYCKTRANLATKIEELVDDVRRCIAANDRLGLGTDVLHMVMVEDVQTDEDYIIDNNRAFALLTLAVQYRQLLDET